MRYYPWVIRGNRTATLAEQVQEAVPAARPGINALLPQRRGGLDVAALQAGLEVGSQVGLRRNLECSAGGRAHRISMGSYTKA